MSNSEKERGIIVVCSKCGYTWIYTGNLIYATCPACQRKVKVRELKKKKDRVEPWR